jgi:Fe-S oxidoreductase
VLYAKHWASVCAGGGSSDLCGSVTAVASHLGEMPTGASSISYSPFPTPGGSALAQLFGGAEPGTLVVLAHLGFWTHSTLVMIFLNLLPLSKHFHVISAVPNVYFRRLEPAGKLSYLGTSEELGEKVMAVTEALEEGKPIAEPVGINRIADLSWKAILDFYTCTECGRCSDHCPAHRTGKILSPKQLTINLRDHLYRNQEALIAAHGSTSPAAKAATVEDGVSKGVEEGMQPEDAPETEGDGAEAEKTASPLDLEIVGNIVHPDVLWACTTCRACEEQCPVLISYVDKIVDMRRSLVLLKGEVAPELASALGAMGSNGNPWNMSAMDRANWAEGLDIPRMSDKPDTPVLYWVGCAASYDDRSKKIARATAKLLKEAGVDFAILGEEETCTGDPARRAGDEYTFAMLAEQNVGTLKGYEEQKGIRKIVTTCPHCFNTIANEYPDFGAKFEVVHHTVFLDELVKKGKLKPKKALKERVVFHDSCYLGRYNGVYDQPRALIDAIPGTERVEVEASRNKGLCCGAGGMQMFMEEQNKDRMSTRRTLQLLDSGAKTIASSCPFCTVMITDGLKAENKEEEIRNLDVAEMLAESCGLSEKVSAAESNVDATADAS